MSHATPFTRLVRPLLVVATAILVSLGSMSAPVNAAPGVPTALTSSAAVIPTLSWRHVPGATQYVVDLSTSESPQGIFVTASTANRHFVPTQPLAWPQSGQLYWRVTATENSTTGVPSAWSQLAVQGSEGAYPAPVITAPTDGTTFTQPVNPATISWEPVEGAQEYEVQISQDVKFSDPTLITTAKTISTTHVVTNPQVATTYFFRVRARVSTATTGETAVYSDLSAPRSYSVSALPPATRVEPATNDSVVDDAVLDWQAIPGAKTYALQIAHDPAFGTLEHHVTGITGTSYARPATLNNAFYYWRVAAVDVAGNTQEWDDRPTWRFRRAWPDSVVPVHPARPDDVNPADPDDTDTGITVGDPFYYEWKPVRFASAYKLELSKAPGFAPNDIVGTCITRNTTFTPSAVTPNTDRCMPAADATYWWRVTAMDHYSGEAWDPNMYPQTSQITADFQDARFTYSPARVTMLTPAAGATVQVPTLSWDALAGASKYRVTINGPTSVPAVNTAATSYTPSIKLAPGTYTWDVVTVSQLDDRGSSNLLPRTFTVEAMPAATAPGPDLLSPISGSFRRFPALRWEPMVGADRYEVWVRVAGGTGWDVLSSQTVYPAATDTSSTYLSPNSYEWMVAAVSSSGQRLGLSGTIGTFTIAAPQVVTGQTNALSMAGYANGDTCTGFSCTDLRQTPILRWDPAAGTGHYRVWISRSDNLSNLVPASLLGVNANPFVVSGTTWTPTRALPEATAGEAYYWVVQPCTADSKCGTAVPPTNSFNKASNAVVSQFPGVPFVNNQPVGTVPKERDDVSLTWIGYLQTNKSSTPGSSQLVTKATQEAREYEVQIDDEPTFTAPLLDSQKVDQRKFTSYAATYPEGNIYWRVRAVDGNGNPLPFSTTRTFEKASPKPMLELINTATSSTPTFRWTPLDFAASYRLEVFPKGSNTSLYLVTSNQVKWSPALTSQSLPPGEYEWRVERADAMGRSGGWSAKSPLVIAESQPVLVAPVNGDYVAPRDSVFNWLPMAGAADYRVVLTPPSGSPLTQITKATSWAPLTKLTPGTWTWHVQPRNSAGKDLGQNSPVTFRVSPDLASTIAPAVEGSGQVSTKIVARRAQWSMVPDDEVHVWLVGSLRVPDDGSLTYTVTEDDLRNYRSVRIEVTSRKAGYPDVTVVSNSIASTQGPAPMAQTPPTITGSGLVGEQLTGNAPMWDFPDVLMTHRWVIAGRSVGTASTYTPTADDLGKEVAFEVTGKRLNYSNAVVTSAPVTVAAGGALQATAQPSITGTPKSGTTLYAESGTWSQPGPTLKYQWLRTGAPIPAATNSTYTLTPADAGKDVTVTVLASKTGFADGSATAPSVFVPKLGSTTTSTLSATRVKKGKTVKVGVTVTVPGVPTPSGVIKIQDGVKTLKTFTLDPFRKGVRTVKLSTKKLKTGRHKIKLVYVGNASTDMSKAKTVRLIVFK